MSADEQSQNNEPAESPVQLPGALLKAAREEAKLSEADVARELRMTVTKVQALEADDYDSLHSDTFIRGYLRTYAKLLGQDPNEILEAYKQGRRQAGLTEEPEESPLQINVPSTSRPLWQFGVSIVVLLVGIWALSVWFLGNHRDTQSPVVDSMPEELPAAESLATEAPSTGAGAGIGAPASEPELSTETTMESAATDDALTSMNEPEPSSGDALSEQTSTETPAVEETDTQAVTLASPDPTPSAGEALDSLRLSFSEECWVEVTDSRGDVLETDLLQPGQTLELSGEAPFTVKLGNAAGATIELNGEPFPFDLPADGKYRAVTVN